MKELAGGLAFFILFGNLAAAEDVAFEKTKIVIDKEGGKSNQYPVIVDFTDTTLVITGKKEDYPDTTTVHYESINDLIYERSKHKRGVVGILLTPFTLFSKRKNHWFTISYDTPDTTRSILLKLDKKEEESFREVAKTKIGMELEVILEDEHDSEE